MGWEDLCAVAANGAVLLASLLLAEREAAVAAGGDAGWRRWRWRSLALRSIADAAGGRGRGADRIFNGLVVCFRSLASR